MPLRKGRTAKGLKVGLGGLAAQSGLSARSRLDDQKLQFEAEIQNDKSERKKLAELATFSNSASFPILCTSLVIDAGNDPLDNWIRYIKWTRMAFPSSTADLLPLLERCTRECRCASKFPRCASNLADRLGAAWCSFACGCVARCTGLKLRVPARVHDRYKQDIRFLRIWILYADCCTDAEDIFAFMESNGFGTEHSLFYEAKAVVHEACGNYAKADQTYEAGIKASAKPSSKQPIDHLQRKHAEFTKRLVRQMQKQREMDSGDVKKERRAGTKLSRSDARSSHRPVSSRRIASHSNSRSGRNSTTRTSGSSSRRAVGSEKTSTTGNFKIFEGPGDDSAPPGQPPIVWNDLGTQRERHKENTGMATAWHDQQLAKQGPSAATKNAPETVQEFEVFTDETCSQQERSQPRGAGAAGLRAFLDEDVPTSKHRLAAQIQSQPLSSTTANACATAVAQLETMPQVEDGQESPPAFETDVPVMAEKAASTGPAGGFSIFEEPVSADKTDTVLDTKSEHFDAPVQNNESMPPPPPSTVQLTEGKTARAGEDGPPPDCGSPTMTFNSKAAMADVMQMFSSPMRPKVASAAADGEGKAPKPAAASGGFAIFDESSSEPGAGSCLAPAPAAPAASAASTGPAGGFSIFEESEEEFNAPSKHGNLANSPLQVAAGYDTTGDGKIDRLDVNGDGTFDLKIVPLPKPVHPRPSFGSPTMTINTKAAMADVQQMFSSPLANDDFNVRDEDDSCSSPTEKFDSISLQGLPVLDDDRESLAFHGTQTIGANMSTIHESSEQGAIPIHFCFV
eukprot:SAG31_NODE_698_length_12746_cov_3.495136_9_plen_796_part_00